VPLLDDFKKEWGDLMAAATPGAPFRASPTPPAADHESRISFLEAQVVLLHKYLLASLDETHSGHN
jgi:hypothetical protein